MYLTRTIFYRNHFDGGDGWTYYPLKVQIGVNCPVCGQPRSTEPTHENFCEDGEWFAVDRWQNSCGHIDTYGACYAEHKELLKKKAIEPLNQSSAGL